MNTTIENIPADPTTEQAPYDFWAQPWGWIHAIIIQLAVVVIAFPIQWQLWGKDYTRIFAFPFNWIYLLGFVAIAFILSATCYKQSWMRWLSGAPFAIIAISIISLFGLLGTLIVQVQAPAAMANADPLTRLGIRHIFTSIPFAVSILFMLLNLTTVLARRLVVRRPGTLAFVLNHGGLILVILAMMAGRAQFVIAYIDLKEGQTGDVAYDDRDRPHKLDAAVELKKFDLEQFPPKIAAEALDERGQSHFAEDQHWVEKGRHVHLLGMHIDVLEYLNKAVPDEKVGWIATKEHGRSHVTKIKVTLDNDQSTEGWISPGIESLMVSPLIFDVDASRRIGFMEPQPKAFRSHLTITTAGKEPVETTLAVNQPVRAGSWQLYQASYRRTMEGRHSVLEAIHDPSLPLAYTGMIAMLLGSFVALWFKPRRRQTGSDTETTQEVQA